MTAATELIPIHSLPPAVTPLSGNEEIPLDQAGNTSKATAFDFVLPADPTILYTNIGRLVSAGARVLMAGTGIVLNLGTPGQIIISAASTSGGPVIFNSKVLASPTSDENDWNPTGWNGGLDKSSLRVTPAGGGTTISGIDMSAMVDGQTFHFMNMSDVDSILLLNESALSAAMNRFFLPLGADFPVLPGQCVILVYETDSNRLRIIG